MFLLTNLLKNYEDILFILLTFFQYQTVYFYSSNKMIQNSFIIRPLDPELLLKNQNHEVSKKKIEMIPFDRPNFEFISFIDFAKFTKDQYYATEMNHQNDKSAKIRMYARNNNCFRSSSQKYWFLVEFGHNLSSIKVYIKYHIIDFKFDVKDSIPCLKYISNNNYLENVFKRSYIPEKDTLLFNVAKYYLNAKHDCQDCIRECFIRYTNPSINFSSALNKITGSIMDVLNTCPGYIQIVYQKNKDEDEKSDIQTISIIFPWANSTLSSIQYLELDGSFDGMSPYVYCVPQGILYNESIPLGLTIAPTECLELYQSFFDDISKYAAEPIKWDSMTVVSDMHASIKSVCKKLGITQFFCHRHLHEHFGSSCSLAFLVNKLLKCFSLDQYLSIIQEVTEEIDEYKVKRLKIGPISDELEVKINEAKIMASYEDCDKNSDYYYKRWALWIRRERHVGRCSNHNEALHSVINREVKQTYG